MSLWINSKSYKFLDKATVDAIIDKMKIAGVIVNHRVGLESVLLFYINETTDYRFDNIQKLADKLTTLRANYFFNKGDENNNLAQSVSNPFLLCLVPGGDIMEIFLHS